MSESTIRIACPKGRKSMRRITLLIFVSLVSLAGGASVLAQSGIETEYDKFRDFTFYRLDLGEMGDDEDEAGTHAFSISALHAGKERKPIADSDPIRLGILRSGRRWRYIDRHDVIMMEGDNRFKIRSYYKGELDSKNAEVNEYFGITMTAGQAKERLASGQDWEIKIGFWDPIPLGPKTRRKIQEFIDYVQKP
jgi:hypothetical protein